MAHLCRFTIGIALLCALSGCDVDIFFLSLLGVELEAQRDSVTCPKSHSLCVSVCGSSPLILVVFKQVNRCMQGHSQRGICSGSWGSMDVGVICG